MWYTEHLIDENYNPKTTCSPFEHVAMNGYVRTMN